MVTIPRKSWLVNMTLFYPHFPVATQSFQGENMGKLASSAPISSGNFTIPSFVSHREPIGLATRKILGNPQSKWSFLAANINFLWGDFRIVHPRFGPGKDLDSLWYLEGYPAWLSQQKYEWLSTTPRKYPNVACLDSKSKPKQDKYRPFSSIFYPLDPSGNLTVGYWKWP